MLGGNLGSLLYRDVSVMNSWENVKECDIASITVTRLCNMSRIVRKPAF